MRAFVNHKPKSWVKLLHWAEWSYNTSVHTTTGLTHFQVVYDKEPPIIPNYITGTSNLEAIDSTFLSRDELLTLLRENFLQSQQKNEETRI